MGFQEDFQRILEGARERCGTLAELSDLTGINQASLSKLFHGPGEKTFNQKVIARALDALGAKLSAPGSFEPSREVCFVDAKIVSAGSLTPPPEAENYLAVPLVGEVGAGPGIIAQDDILSWVLVYKEHRSVKRRSNLLAVEVGRNQRSMIPTLHPGDIVLVDRDDWGDSGYAPPGNIFLVREPGQDGGGMVKRVAVAGKGSEATITFYSDNAAEYGPEVYHMHRYEHDSRRAVVGRVVWAWADLSRK